MEKIQKKVKEEKKMYINIKVKKLKAGNKSEGKIAITNCCNVTPTTVLRKYATQSPTAHLPETVQ